MIIDNVVSHAQHADSEPCHSPDVRNVERLARVFYKCYRKVSADQYWSGCARSPKQLDVRHQPDHEAFFSFHTYFYIICPPFFFFVLYFWLSFVLYLFLPTFVIAILLHLTAVSFLINHSLKLYCLSSDPLMSPLT